MMGEYEQRRALIQDMEGWSAPDIARPGESVSAMDPAGNKFSARLGLDGWTMEAPGSLLHGQRVHVLKWQPHGRNVDF